MSSDSFWSRQSPNNQPTDQTTTQPTNQQISQRTNKPASQQTSKQKQAGKQKQTNKPIKKWYLKTQKNTADPSKVRIHQDRLEFEISSSSLFLKVEMVSLPRRPSRRTFSKVERAGWARLGEMSRVRMNSAQTHLLGWFRYSFSP